MCLFGLHGATEIDYTIDDEEIKACRNCLKEVEWTLATSVAFAERITAHKTPLNMHYWWGFSFLIWTIRKYRKVGCMDIVEAKRNLELLGKNRSRLMNYNHLFSSYAFKESCGAELRKINKQIHCIEEQLNAQSQKTRRDS